MFHVTLVPEKPGFKMLVNVFSLMSFQVGVNVNTIDFDKCAIVRREFKLFTGPLTGLARRIC